MATSAVPLILNGVSDATERLMGPRKIADGPICFTIGSSSSESSCSSQSAMNTSCSNNQPDDDDIMIVDEVTVQTPDLRKRGLSLDDFDVLKTIGKGGFGKVFLVRPRRSVLDGNASGDVLLDPNEFYAIKAIRKSRLAANKTELKHTKSEHHALKIANDHPFIVKLISTFQSHSRIFFLTEFLAGGELFQLLTIKDLMPENEAKFYLAELILALGFLHSNGIIYRDLKPENIMLDKDGHVKLIDFGLARDDLQETLEPVKMTYCGTKEYMAPEVYFRRPYNRSADWWSLGAVAYDMIVGEFPFTAGNYDSPIGFPKRMSSDAKKFIRKLLITEPERRLGDLKCGGIQGIKKAPFFREVRWNDVYMKRIQPPYIPTIDTSSVNGLVRNFDKEFLKLPAELSVSGNGTFGFFKDFDYVHPDNARPPSEPSR